ncbi:prephenate dehydratase [Pustulibacterium marinum]|uniref:prephenate dehydratase n=1 Tax=Pustulibacterium marinum TaxID=1224947 RepID=A0A1I7GNC7_9FLAO|nr:prephenate dehydratase [Pustulibacterium marinum]SFU49992.1 prephenate dehydratase [Pustulibacterium marinum]
MNEKVAIQGIKGCFHHKVALEYFGENVDIVECLSFDALVDEVVKGNATIAVMAIENSIAGSIIPNYALIDSNNLHVIGEYFLNISHNLMVLPGQTIEDITEVHSHPMALLQCKEFFKKYPHIRLIEAADTAEAAKIISEKQLKGAGAIASSTAAELYELEVLNSDIQTIKDNSTRFVIVKTQNSVLPKDQINKASLKFELDHKRGSLATVLNVMSDCRLNLTKIQSLPVIETPWKYAFFVNVTFDAYADFDKAVKLLTIMADKFKILGEYKNARK